MGEREPWFAALPPTLPCERCEGVERVLRAREEGSEWMAYYCPCCKSGLRTIELLTLDTERRASERGITVAELREESRGIINPEPLSPEALAGLRSLVEKRAAEWTPACEHDTQNPWAANSHTSPVNEETSG